MNDDLAVIQGCGMLFGLMIGGMVGLWVYSDARKRGKEKGEAAAWGLVTWMVLIIALPCWLLTRPKLASDLALPIKVAAAVLCKNCGKYYEAVNNPAFCPNCGGQLR